MNNNWSYTNHKQQATELIRRAHDERIVVAQHTPTAAPNPVAAWVGEKLIELGSRLTAEPTHNDGSDYFIAENAR